MEGYMPDWVLTLVGSMKKNRDMVITFAVVAAVIVYSQTSIIDRVTSYLTPANDSVGAKLDLLEDKLRAEGLRIEQRSLQHTEERVASAEKLNAERHLAILRELGSQRASVDNLSQNVHDLTVLLIQQRDGKKRLSGSIHKKEQPVN